MLSELKKISLFLFTITLFISVSSFSQQDSAGSKSDSVKSKHSNDFVYDQEYLRKMADSSGKLEAFKFREKQIRARQMTLISNLQKNYFQFEDFYHKEIDTARIEVNLSRMEFEYENATKGIVKDSIPATLRDLITTSILLEGLLKELDSKKIKIEKNLFELQNYRTKIDSIQTDSTIYYLAKDSVLFIEYLSKIFEVALATSRPDSLLTNSISFFQGIEKRMGLLNSKIVSSEQFVLQSKNQLWQNIFSKETSGLFGSSANAVSTEEAVNYSYTKGVLVLIYYLDNNYWKIFFLPVVFIFILNLTLRTTGRYKLLGINNSSDEILLIIKHPVLVSAFSVLVLFDFLFTNPPLIFQGIIWIISSAILTIILWGYWSGLQRVFWMYLILSFATVLFNSLIIKETLFERWYIFIVASSGIAAAYLALKMDLASLKGGKGKRLLLAVSILLFVISIIANLSGRYNLSKSFLTISFFMLLIAYLLFWLFIFITEFLNIFALTQKNDVNESYNLKLQRIIRLTPKFLLLVFVFEWLILIFRNFFIYDYITGGVIGFLQKDISVGDFTFTFEKILIFISIILISMLISRAISFTVESSSAGDRKSRLSNWMLLIKILVISSGVLLALAATGIPIDRLTIIIGSLGVGIGLGLQSVVNNLVSGVLLAFEKPFQIGDQIEVGDKTGRIKEIGIRSTKLSTPDGADIIIPNGDLLSKYVTNWTLTNSLKRTELVLSFDNEDQNNKIKDILENILHNKKDIVKYPSPKVFLNDLDKSSSEYKLSYWTEISEATEVKSAVLIQIKNELRNSFRNEESNS